MSSTTTVPARVFGYVRVSTSRQTHAQQVDALTAAGVDPAHIFADTISGATSSRPGLDALLAQIRPGDTLTVVALDRLGRSVTHVLTTANDLVKRGIVLKSLRENIDMSTASGRAMAGMFAVMAELERELIAERSAAARESARKQGKQTGRPTVLDAKQVAEARRMKAAGATAATICQALGVSRATLYRHLGSAA